MIIWIGFIRKIFKNSLFHQFVWDSKMNGNIELKASALESKVQVIFHKIKQMKQLFREIRLDLTTLLNSEEYEEIKEFLGSKRNQESLDHNLLELPSAKKFKSHAESGKSTTDSPYLHYNSEDLQESSIKSTENNFIKEGDYVVVYTDGACEHNGKPNAKAGIGVWFAKNHPLNVSRPVEGNATNNTAEIQACVTALEILHSKDEHRCRS